MPTTAPCERQEHSPPSTWLQPSSEPARIAGYFVERNQRANFREYARRITQCRRQEFVRSIARELAKSSRAAEPLEQKFRRLAGEWSRDVGNVSSVSAMTSHPKYREIVKLGWDAVPLMLADLREKRGFWFSALHEITKIRPFDPSDAGNSKRMSDAWLSWGKNKKIPF